jgi:single-stranded DNA-binding protein
MIVNTVIVEGVLNADPVINAWAGKHPVCVVTLEVERPTVNGEGQPPFDVTVMAVGPLASHLVATTRRYYRVRVTGRLDVFVLSTDDSPHRCEPGVAAAQVEIIADEPF